LDDRSYIRVNERLETSAPDVWAVGECAGSPQFTIFASFATISLETLAARAIDWFLTACLQILRSLAWVLVKTKRSVEGSRRAL
jgi:hypothetical protein